jgi:hypothetical protein
MQFFVLRKAVGSQFETDFLKSDPVQRGDAPRCPRCGQFIGMKEWLPPFRAELDAYGEAWGDIAGPHGEELLVSDRFKAWFEEHQLTGLQTFAPVEVVAARTKHSLGPPPPYLRASVARSGATIDDARSNINRYEPISCDECRQTPYRRIDGFEIDRARWSGEDIFVARGLPGQINVTGRFVTLARDAGLRNIITTRSDRFVWDEMGRGLHAVP